MHLRIFNLFHHRLYCRYELSIDRDDFFIYWTLKFIIWWINSKLLVINIVHKKSDILIRKINTTLKRWFSKKILITEIFREIILSQTNVSSTFSKCFLAFFQQTKNLQRVFVSRLSCKIMRCNWNRFYKLPFKRRTQGL